MLTYGPVKVERWKPEQTHASAYLLADRIILHGDCFTTIGGFACDPYLSMDASASDAELGTALLRILAEARLTPVPTDHKAEQKKILRTAGVRSWSKLSEGVYCSITQTPDAISILPSNSKNRGFSHLPDLIARIAPDSTPEQVGRALREGFQRCI
ncbi:MAG TPA: contact-dependent growth inhibition system immunity protein [Chthoniobacteraceae bacterium]|nr:contact-dependent growth inhibition system immunity protein [Chthoniobacteraceae bacterium]